MTYKDTIDFLFRSLPMYQRIGDAAIKKDLTNIRLLCDMLDQPQDQFASIHIAGTNGKGSTSHMLAAVFQAAGKTVGLYTSPHYVDFRERIRINGRMISQQAVVRFVEQYKDQWRVIQPSFFEITVAMAFDHFRRHRVDMAIIETGLGGRLDSTNIITPMMSVITNIGFDHMQFLGNTLTSIAFEKAGIIKPGIPVVIGEWNKDTALVFREKAKKENAPIHFASKHISLKTEQKSLFRQTFSIRMNSSPWLKKITTDLTGPYQKQNVTTVLESIWCWNKYYPEKALPEQAVRKGLASVVPLTGMIGRWMVMHQKPLVIADAAHNEHGMRAMLPQLLSIRAKQRHFVLGFVSDKDVQKILKLFPADGKYYWCAPDIPRGKNASETQNIAAELHLIGDAYISVGLAFRAAMKEANPGDLIFVGGSSYVVGDFLHKKTLQR